MSSDPTRAGACFALALLFLVVFLSSAWTTPHGWTDLQPPRGADQISLASPGALAYPPGVHHSTPKAPNPPSRLSISE